MSSLDILGYEYPLAGGPRTSLSARHIIIRIYLTELMGVRDRLLAMGVPRRLVPETCTTHLTRFQEHLIDIAILTAWSWFLEFNDDLNEDDIMAMADEVKGIYKGEIPTSVIVERMRAGLKQAPRLSRLSLPDEAVLYFGASAVTTLWRLQIGWTL